MPTPWASASAGEPTCTVSPNRTWILPPEGEAGVIICQDAGEIGQIDRGHIIADGLGGVGGGVDSLHVVGLLNKIFPLDTLVRKGAEGAIADGAADL